MYNKIPFLGSNILLTGGTGSLGSRLLDRLIPLLPGSITILSRDEDKQYSLRHKLNRLYPQYSKNIKFIIGDIRDYSSVCLSLEGIDIVLNVAALKQVPTCEYFPVEAVKTNVLGPENIVRAIRENKFNVNTVIGISTDKACKPINALGLTKALQEKVFISANLTIPNTRFIIARYGNVLLSRGSVVPLFLEQIKNGGPITITTNDMTRFLMTLDQSVDIVFDAYSNANAGEIFIPKVPAGYITDIAKVLRGDKKIEIKKIGIRPGEKIHEILVSEEEIYRTYDIGNNYVITPHFDELKTTPRNKLITGEYSSKDNLVSYEQVLSILKSQQLC
jgi:FlaA1/EpsC-like NDP-sugar epimerase